MTRYLVFAGETFYGRGGWCDYIGTATTIDEAKRLAKKSMNNDFKDWWQIVNAETQQPVASHQFAYNGFNIMTGEYV